MAIDPAIGLITEAEERLGECFANSTRFQSITNSADANEAKQHIYYGTLPMPANGSFYTKEEHEGYRPFALIWQVENTGLTITKIGELSQSITSGAVFAEVVISSDPSDGDDVQERKLKNTVGEILFRTTQDPQAFTAVCQYAWETGAFTLQRAVIRDISHWQLGDEPEQGEFGKATIEFNWGVAE